MKYTAEYGKDWRNGSVGKYPMRMGSFHWIMRLRHWAGNFTAIFFTGVYESDSGKTEETALGITVAMESGVLLQKTVFNENAEEGSDYGYYVEDDKLYYISRREGSALFV